MAEKSEEILVPLSDIEYYVRLDETRKSNNWEDTHYGNKKLKEHLTRQLEEANKRVSVLSSMVRVLEYTGAK